MSDNKVEAPVYTKKSPVIYLGHIPRGFYEAEMRKFFTQFGEIKNLRLSRNKKTGNSKHYAYIEFNEAEVAEIVAKTMNGYLLFGQSLKCEVVPSEKIHPELFKGANKRFYVQNNDKKVRELINAERSKEDREKAAEKQIKAMNEKFELLKSMGIDYSILEVKELEKKEEKKEKTGKK